MFVPKAGIRSKRVPGELIVGPDGLSVELTCEFAGVGAVMWAAGILNLIFVE